MAALARRVEVIGQVGDRVREPAPGGAVPRGGAVLTPRAASAAPAAAERILSWTNTHSRRPAAATPAAAAGLRPGRRSPRRRLPASLRRQIQVEFLAQHGARRQQRRSPRGGNSSSRRARSSPPGVENCTSAMASGSTRQPSAVRHQRPDSTSPRSTAEAMNGLPSSHRRTASTAPRRAAVRPSTRPTARVVGRERARRRCAAAGLAAADARAEPPRCGRPRPTAHGDARSTPLGADASASGGSACRSVRRPIGSRRGSPSPAAADSPARRGSCNSADGSRFAERLRYKLIEAFQSSAAARAGSTVASA